MKIAIVSRRKSEAAIRVEREKIAALKEKNEAAKGKLRAKCDQAEARASEQLKAASFEIDALQKTIHEFRSELADVIAKVRGHQDRRLLLAMCLEGEGIEIGALHHPLPVPEGVKVRYVDYKTREQNIKNHPELDASKIVVTDYVCNGELLEVIPDESQDFVIANHMVEHCINPLGTLEQFLRVLKPGGLIFISLPDKRYTFDILRDISPFSNPAEDYRIKRTHEPLESYVEFCTRAQDSDGVEAYEEQANLHFHDWTESEIVELFSEARRTFRIPLEIELAGYNGIEFIVVLRKEVPEAYDRVGMVSRERQA